MQQKLAPDFLKEDYQKFLSNPVPFNGQNDKKQKGPRTSHQSLFRLQNKFRKVPSLVLYYLTKFDGVKYKAVFELF